MKKKVRVYEGEGIQVEFDAARCIHAAECVRGLPSVFDTRRRPWIQPDQAPAEEVARTVLRCPSGALRARRPEGGAEEEPAAENTVTPAPDGPLYARGRIELRDAEGNLLSEETRVALCRCGLSENKPLCDGAHDRGRFEDPGSMEHAKAGSGPPGDGPLVVQLAPGGPLLMKGPWRLEVGRESVDAPKGALCRCGASARKPFCDGSHGPAGFEG